MKEYKGMMILDSLIALLFFCSLLAGIAVFRQQTSQRNNAKLLASQTERYAEAFAWYMHNNYESAAWQLSGTVTLTRQSLADKWPTELATVNFLGQAPCVVITPSRYGTDALMYYTGGRSSEVTVNNDALMLLGNIGGILHDGKVYGNSGWSTDNLSAANGCGEQLANGSLVINLNLLPDWNLTLQPDISVSKMPYPVNPANIRTLPGHLQNTNTVKANITFTNNSGVIIDNSDSANPVLLNMAYGAASNQATLAVGSDNTTLVADTFQPVQQGQSGDACLPDELGKIIVDSGNQNNAAYQFLARNTLVCTQNTLQCGSVNASQTCYIPSIANSIVFQNNNAGVQNQQGQFICPPVVPFATNIVTSLGGSNGSQIILATLSGYSVAVGYTANESVAISSVTCSNMPVYHVGN